MNRLHSKIIVYKYSSAYKIDGERKIPAPNVTINRTTSNIRLFISWKSSPTPLGNSCCDWLDFCVPADMVSFIAIRLNLCDSSYKYQQIKTWRLNY